MIGKISSILQQDLVKHNAQYPPIVLTEKKDIHDRFLIVDEDVYHIGASLKDLGKKLFAFSKMNISGVYDKLYRGTEVYSPSSSIMRVMPA